MALLLSRRSAIFQKRNLCHCGLKSFRSTRSLELPFSFPRNLPNPGIEPRSSALQADSLEPSGKPIYLDQFSSVQSLSCVRLFADPMNPRTPDLPVHHQLPEFTQTHIHQVSDAIQPSHPLSSPSPAPNSSQHQSLFQ